MVVAIAVLVAVPECALGQQTQANITRRLERQLQSAEQQYELRVNPALQLTERMLLEYGGRANFSFMAVDDTDQKTRILRQTTIQLYGDLNIDGAHRFFGRLQYQYRDFNSGDSFDGDGDGTEWPLGDRYWYRFDLSRAIEAYEGRRSDLDLTLQVGRQYVTWGSGLTLSNQLYALRGTVELDTFRLDGLAGTTPSSTVIDFDSSRPSFDGDTDRLFIGGSITYTGLEDHSPYVFVLSQEDQNNENFTVIFNPTPAIGDDFPTSFEYDSMYFGIGSTGKLAPRLLYSAEFVFETGRGLTDPTDRASPLGPAPQTKEDVEAWAGILNLSYLFRDAHLSRLDVGAVFASGDDDRFFDTSTTFGGNLTGSKDRAFNAFGYVPSGLAFGTSISNLMMFRAGASTFPLREQELFERLQVGAELYVFNKMNTDAPIDELTTDDRFLGIEAGCFAAWRIFSDVAVNVRYSVFFPGTAITADGDERHFFFTGITYAF